jgi:hypothetical protein
MEQWILTGGNANSWAISLFFKAAAWSKVFPLTHSVTKDDEAMAELGGEADG